MNATERGRRSDALYYDNISRRELCDMIAHLESDLAESKAENAKLRELVRDAWGDGHPDKSCEGCDIRDECHNDVERMRKDADEYMDAMGLSPVTKAAYHDARGDFLRMADEKSWY